MFPEDLLSEDIIVRSLKTDKGKDAQLLSWTHENCTKFGYNFFNVVKRLTVRYLKDGSEDETSYIAKLNPCKDNDVFNPYRQRAMVKEIFFYEELLPILNSELHKMGQENLNVPKYFYSSVDVEKEVIILEDLKLKGFETMSREVEMDAAHTELMVKEIGRLHAASFALQSTLGNTELKKVYPLLVESWMVGDPKLRNAFESVFIKGIKHDLHLVKAMEDFKDMIPWLQNLTTIGMETLLKEMQSNSPWEGICHGDYHRANVLFRYNELNVPQEVMIVDWQTVRVAHPASEISYLLYSSYFGPSRALHFPIISQAYFETFQKIIGSSTFFSKQEFEVEVKNNNVGLLVCFYLVPLSLCVNDPSELFKIDENAETISETEALKTAKDYLETKKNLTTVMVDYLNEVSRSNLLK